MTAVEARRAIGLSAILLALALGAARPAGAAEREVARDDGTMAGKQSAAGTGHVVAFGAPKGEAWVTAIRVYGSRYGGGYDPATTRFRVAICHPDLARLVESELPYEIFPAGRFGWVDVRLPRVPRVSGPFRVVVAFDPSATRGVYVGWAKTSATHSAFGLPGGEETAVEPDREWMIRAVVADRPPKDAVRVVELSVDGGTRTGERSLAGGGHAVELTRPAGTWWIEAVRIHGRRYGGGYDPDETRFGVSLTGTKGEVLHEERAPYASFSPEGFRWVETPFRDPPKAPARFRLVADFAPEATKGVYVGYAALDAKAESFVTRAGAAATPFREGEWMIRALLVSAVAPPAKVERARDPGVYLGDLDAIERTVRESFPALEKKGVDWPAAVAAARPAFAACRDDRTHLRNVHRLLARLGDSHTGVAESETEVHVPAFDGLYGAGLWIAEDGGRLVLRALVPGHPLASRLKPGALLASVDGRAATEVLAETRARLREWSGWSSTHFLDARLSFQFFPFGERETLPARFLLRGERGLEPVDVSLSRWGPGGAGLSRAAVTLPEGVRPEGRAVSARLDGDLGYLRILGGMDAETEAEFHAAMDRLKGVKGILLDGRGMGGGGDPPAWAMAGRFFARSTPLRHDPALRPTGDWQLEGPVVFLQDERMVSSAETFTWAIAETGRAVSVGRPTGGATIIPRTFDVPSRLFRYRLGVRDRETSVRGVQPEGIGSPPDVLVPCAPSLLARTGDPERAVGLDVLRLLVAGAAREAVVDLYGGVLAADPERAERSAAAFRKVALPQGLAFPDVAGALVEELIRDEEAAREALGGDGDRLDRLRAVRAALLR